MTWKASRISTAFLQNHSLAAKLHNLSTTTKTLPPNDRSAAEQFTSPEELRQQVQTQALMHLLPSQPLSAAV